MKKRGLSAVITTLIIILLVLVAVGVVWVVIANLINSGAEEISLGKFTLNMEIKNVEVKSDGTVDVKVKRNAGKGELSGIKFLVSDGDEVIEIEKETTMGELGQRTFSFSSSEVASLIYVKEVSIAPIFKLESGKESIGNEIDKEKSVLGTKATPGFSCKNILDNGDSKGDKVYWIDTNGVGGGDSFEVYCDMTTDGGGWTFLGHFNNNGGGTTFFTDIKGTYKTDRVDDDTTYSMGFVDELDDIEMMVTLDDASPVIANGNDKIVFFRYDVDHTGFNSGPIPCTGLDNFEYKTQIGDSYTSGGTTNSCGGTNWYSRTVGSGAYLVLFHSSGNGNYWGAGMGGDNSWSHDGWWYVR